MRPRRSLAVVAIAVAGVAAIAWPAAAHVTVNPDEAPKGSFAKLTFRVPNEKDAASTTGVEVDFPTDHRIVTASVKPVPGWTAKVETSPLPKPEKDDDGNEITEAVSKITWSGGKIGPGEFQEFDVSVLLPSDGDSLTFKALQTYDDGDIVRWIEDTPAGGAEPEHPAPVLTLTAASADHHATTATTAPGDKGDDDKGDEGGSDALPIVAIVLAVVAIAASGASFVTRRR
jgi:uncharacterized protein YcnI